MIDISKNAQKHFSLLLSKEPVGTQIRVFIINPGMPNAECGVAYCSKDEIEKSDVQFQYSDFSVYVNKDILSYLKNSEIDLITDNLGSQLTLKAPYSKNNISINKFSSLEEKVKHFLNIEINPQLSMHGGSVKLLEIDKNFIAMIQFSGGCNGCSMIGSTLKETVEKKILAYFSEIKEVRDNTDHTHGKHSFY